MPVFQPNELSEVVMGLAFAIEDPCGFDAIELARALVQLGRAVPIEHRKTIVGLCETWTRSFESTKESTNGS
jgi:hypothetical protein